MAKSANWYRDEETGQYIFDVSLIVHAPLDVCFAEWENFENFPKLMSHITEVHRTGDNSWHWEAVVGGKLAKWEAVTTEYNPGEMIAWQSIEGLHNSGVVYFSPEGADCRISVHLAYDPPYGILGDLVAQQRTNETFVANLKQDLLNFKHSVESRQADKHRRAA